MNKCWEMYVRSDSDGNGDSDSDSNGDSDSDRDGAMATTVSVRVRGRLHKITCPATETLLSVLERACAKAEDVDPSEHGLTHHGRPLDLSLGLQFSRVPNNATLELEPVKTRRVETDVNLVVQLSDGTRASAMFPSGTNLYDIISQLAAREYERNPNLVVIYMRREIFGEAELKTTTLRMLGLIGGRALLRIIHADIESLKTQPNVSSVVQYKTKTGDNSENDRKPEETVGEKESRVRDYSDSVEIEAEDKPELLNEPSDPADVDRSDALMIVTNSAVENVNTENQLPSKKSESCEIIYLGERKALAFSQKLASKFQFDDVPDDFYELTPNELRKLMKDLERKRMELENKPLQISTKPENSKKNENKYKEAMIRIYFPDQTILQGCFEATETISDVINFVRVHLQDPTRSFHIYTSPPKKILESESSLIDCNCVPNAIMYFGCNESIEDSYLSLDIIEKLTSPEIANMSAYSQRKVCQVPQKTDEKKSVSTNKIPKWFKNV